MRELDLNLENIRKKTLFSKKNQNFHFSKKLQLARGKDKQIYIKRAESENCHEVFSD